MSRPRKKHSNKQIVDAVTKIRRRNNLCWMMLLRLALDAKPRKAKKIVQEIVENDRKVSSWMAKV